MAPKPKKPPKKKGKARNRRDRHDHEPVNYYTGPVSQTFYRGFDFRCQVIRDEKHGRKKVLAINPVVVGISWDDVGPIRSANLSLQHPTSTKELPIKRGHEIRVMWSPRGSKQWHPLWRLRVMKSVYSGSSRTMEVELADELQWLAKTKEDFTFKKGDAKSEGKRPKGWYAHQIAKEVCREYGIPMGKFARGRHRIKNLTEEGISPIKAIEKAYELDRDETGRKFVVGVWNGKLSVKLLRRSKTMLVLGKHLLEASYSTGFKDSFATVLDVTGSYKKKEGDDKKLEIQVRSSKVAMRRYGVIRAEWKIDDPVYSEANVRERAKRRLVHMQEPDQELSVTVPGIPTLQRGDALRVSLPQVGLSELVYAKTVTHSASAESYTTDLTCQFTDPFKDKEGDKTREKICKTAREKGRTLPAFCTETYDPYAPKRTPKRNRRDRK
jgi:hypothetical protein